MKNKRILNKIIYWITTIVILLSSTGLTFANEENILMGEARQLADEMFYNLTNVSDWDNCKVTPLTDKDGTITYFCFDYLKENKGVGYILVSASSENVLIPEYSDNGFSDYYLNSIDKKENVYYTPFENYIKFKGKFYDENGLEIEKKQIKGTVKKANKQENKNLMSGKSKNIKKIKQSQNSLMGTGSDGCYDSLLDPWSYVSSQGGTNAIASGYATLESKIVHNSMLSGSEYNLVKVAGVPVSNPNHCLVTAAANCMLYHRTICCGAFPNNESPNDAAYYTFMSRLFTVCYHYDYFNVFGDSNFPFANITSFIKNAFKNYGYNNAKSQLIVNPSWPTITDRIEEFGQPFILSGQYYKKTSSTQKAEHSVAVYAFNKISCYKNSQEYVFRFLKIANGYAKSGRYISYNDYIVGNTLRMITVEPY